MTTDAKLLADLNSARISALAGREAARHWCPNLEGDFDSILKGIDAAIERCQLYVHTPSSDLIERCREVLAWKASGVLTGDALRLLATTKEPKDYGLRLAEIQTADEAMQFVVDSICISSRSET